MPFTIYVIDNRFEVILLLSVKLLHSEVFNDDMVGDSEAMRGQSRFFMNLEMQIQQSQRNVRKDNGEGQERSSGIIKFMHQY